MDFGRLSPCLIGMEACTTSHHWARELAKLGHEVRLVPPRYAYRQTRYHYNTNTTSFPLPFKGGIAGTRFLP